MNKTRNDINFSWAERFRLSEGWLTFFLLLLAFMTVVWSLQGAAWVTGIGILPAAGLMGFGVGFALAKTRFVPGLLAHSFMLSVGMVLVGVLIFPYTDPRYEEWYYKMGSTVQRIVKWCSNALAGRANPDELVGLVGLGLAVWILGYSAAWFLFRRQRVWWSITVLGSVLILNLGFNPPNAVSSFTIFLISALLLVVRFNAFQNEERWRHSRLYFRPGTVRWSVGVGVGMVLALVAISFAAPSSSEFKPLQSLFDQLSTPIQSVQSGLTSIFSSPGDGKDKRIGRLTVNYNSFNKSFTIGGPISLSNDPVLQVKGSDPSYLQAAVMDQYDGKGWIATYQDAGVPTDIVFPQLSLGADQRLPTNSYTGRFENTLDITPLVPNLNTLFIGGDAVSTNRTSLLAFHWEKTVLRNNISNFQSVEMGTSTDGRSRVVLADITTMKPIPPDLLPLVRLLRDATTLPNYVEFRNGGYMRASFGGKLGSVTAVSSPTGVWKAEINGWLYQVEGLNGASSPIAKVTKKEGGTQTYEYVLNPRSNGIYAYGDATGDQARKEFEQTSFGKDIRVELDRLRNGPFPSTVDYSIAEGKPSFFAYDGYQPNYDDLLAVSSAQNLNNGEAYRTVGLRYRADVESLRKADTLLDRTRIIGDSGSPTAVTRSSTLGYPDWVQNRYLQLPANIPPRVRDLARKITAGQKTTYDKAKALETYLRTFKYNENTPVTPEGRDIVDYLLFDSKEGYCVHFATAFNVMARSIGIPTRMATGFVGGEYDAASGSYVVRGKAAHAWPQVYFPGSGWVNFEPTPAYSSISRPANPADVVPLPTPTPVAVAAPGGTVTPSGTSAPTDPEANTNTGNENTDGTPANPANAPQSGVDVPLWLIMMGVVLLGVAAAFQFNVQWKKRQFRLVDASPRGVYSRMVEMARKSGMPGRQAMTPFEYSKQLARTLPEAAPALASITARYVRDRYDKPEQVNDTVATAEMQKAENVSDMPQQPGNQQIQIQWELYVKALLEYRKQRTLNRITPRFLRKNKRRK